MAKKKKAMKKPAKKMAKRAPKKAKKVVKQAAKKPTKKSTTTMKRKGASKAVKKAPRKVKRATSPNVLTEALIITPDVETTETIIIETIEPSMPTEPPIPASSMENDTLMSG
jgi:hypothetical protein